MHIIFEINCTTVTRVGCRIMGGFQEILCWTTADIVRLGADGNYWDRPQCGRRLLGIGAVRIR
jgi:hypothetical protein